MDTVAWTPDQLVRVGDLHAIPEYESTFPSGKQKRIKYIDVIRQLEDGTFTITAERQDAQ